MPTSTSMSPSRNRAAARRARPCAGPRRDPDAPRAPPGHRRVDFCLHSLGAEARLLQIRRRHRAGTSAARAPSSCSSGSARAASCPRRARPATRCSSGSRACRRTAGRTPPSRIRAGSAGRATARRARAGRRAPAVSARLSTTSGPVAAYSSRMSTTRHRGKRPVEDAPLEHDVLVLAGRSRGDSSPSTASPTRAPRARRRAGRGRSPRRAPL